MPGTLLEPRDSYVSSQCQASGYTTVIHIHIYINNCFINSVIDAKYLFSERYCLASTMSNIWHFDKKPIFYYNVSTYKKKKQLGFTSSAVVKCH